ncbi:MAG TPA: NUDIX hydrolase [Candidatus Limnocylindria bacterium]|nr:NUDIX hydrolase [Candidatus Limnocylindria bacterium]
MAGLSEEELRETLVESRVLHEGRYISLLEDVVRDGTGELRRREVVVHPGAVAMIPLLPDGRLLLVRQYRHAARETCLELPAGTLDRRDDGTIEPPDEAAHRELEEETGHRARRWRRLASFFTAPGFASEEMHLYLATELTPVDGYAGPAPDERLRLEVLHWRAALELAQAGGIRDAKTLVGLLWLNLLAERGELP